MAFSNFFNSLWSNIKEAPSFVPTYLEFSPDQTDNTSDKSFREVDTNQHYFSVGISEMFLSYKRRWHQEFSPMVFTLCSFKYGRENIEVPYIIGPDHLSKFKQTLPEGMLFLNTPVVGIHPWQGGNMALSVVLCRVKEGNNVEKILKVVEDVSSKLGLYTGISNFLKIGKVVLDGFDYLMGFEETSPLLGVANNFGQAANHAMRPGFHVIIHEENLDKSKFWVKENRLCYGDNMVDSKPYRENDYVLFRVGVVNERHDVQTLPFSEKYDSIYDFIGNQGKLNVEQRDNLRARMVSLAVDIMKSPDLTPNQSDTIWNEKSARINDFVDKLDHLGPESEGMAATSTPDQVDELMRKANADLKF